MQALTSDQYQHIITDIIIFLLPEHASGQSWSLLLVKSVGHTPPCKSWWISPGGKWSQPCHRPPSAWRPQHSQASSTIKHGILLTNRLLPSNWLSLISYDLSRTIFTFAHNSQNNNDTTWLSLNTHQFHAKRFDALQHVGVQQLGDGPFDHGTTGEWSTVDLNCQTV